MEPIIKMACIIFSISVIFAFIPLVISKPADDRALIYNNTNWCGPGDIAEDEELGPAEATDRCCRTHDKCKYYITAFTYNYTYFNWRPYTISYCKCDLKFKRCLKRADTEVAHAVGDIFFNTPPGVACFILKKRKTKAKIHPDLPGPYP